MIGVKSGGLAVQMRGVITAITSAITAYYRAFGVADMLDRIQAALRQS